MSTSKKSSLPTHALPSPKPTLQNSTWATVPPERRATGLPEGWAKVSPEWWAGLSPEQQSTFQHLRPDNPTLSKLGAKHGSSFQDMTDADSSTGKQLPTATDPGSRPPSTSPYFTSEESKASGDLEAKAYAQSKAIDDLKAKAYADAELRPPLPFVLPNITLATFRATSDRLLEEAGRATYFSPRVIVWALQNKQPLHDIATYINQFPADFVRVKINELILCVNLGVAVPILFFAVEHGSLELIRMLVKAGAELEARTFGWQISLLAYTVLHSEIDKIDTTEIFKLLLALGANPNQIPEDVWKSYVATPKSE